MANQPNILVVGSINMDMVVRSPRMPMPGETLFGEDFKTSAGGKGANQAVAAARLGAHCAMIGRVGWDSFGQQLLEQLSENGVETRNISVTPSVATGVAMIMVDAKGENSIIVASGANSRLTPDDIYSREECFTGSPIVLLQLELPLPTIRASIDLARRHNCRIILDPAPVVSSLPPELYNVSVISPNAGEAEKLTGTPAIEERVDKQVASELIARGAESAVLKLGARGSMVVTADGHFYRIPAYKVDVVDTTGAGDTFTAALGVSLGRGLHIRQAARYANAAGALACTRFGAQQAMPTAKEVEMLMADQPML